MFEECQGKMNKNFGEAHAKHFGSVGNVRAPAGPAIPPDLSVIEQQLKRHESLNADLADSVSGLISHIRKVMRHDPREMPCPESTGQIKAGPLCELEAQMIGLNDALEQQVVLLRQVRGALCL